MIVRLRSLAGYDSAAYWLSLSPDLDTNSHDVDALQATWGASVALKIVRYSYVCDHHAPMPYDPEGVDVPENLLNNT